MPKQTNLIKLAAKLETRANQVAYLRDKGVLPTSVNCQKCGIEVSRTEYCTNKVSFNSTTWTIFGSDGTTQSDCSLIALWLLPDCSLTQKDEDWLLWRSFCCTVIQSFGSNKHCEALVSCSGQKIHKDSNLNLPRTFINLQGPSGTFINL